MARSMIFDIIADPAKAISGLDRFKAHSDLVAGVIGGSWATMKIGQGIFDSLEVDAIGQRFEAQFDLTEAAATRASDAATASFRDGMGESLDDVSRTVQQVGEDMVDLESISEGTLTTITTNVLAISDAWMKDSAEITRAAGQLMKTGLAKDAVEALDIITAGMQAGLDNTGEFLDTLWEYSEPISQLGFSGQEALALLEAGLDAGAFSIDKIGDSLNEFAIRSIDNSAASREAYALLGVDADAMAQKFANGGPVANAAFAEIIQGIGAMDDAVQQDAVGVALFGSMWEDAGKEMILAMDPAALAVQDVTDKTQQMGDTLYDTATNKAEVYKRKFDGLITDMMTLPGVLGEAAAMTKAFGGDIIGGAMAVSQIAEGVAVFAKSQKVMAAATKLSSAATAVGTGIQWLWNAALTANPIGIVIVAVAALVAGLTWFFTKTELGQKIWETYTTALGAYIGFIWNDVLKPIFGFIVDYLQWVGDKYAWLWNEIIYPVFSAIGSFFSAWWETTKGIFSGAWDFIVGIFQRSPLGQVVENWDQIVEFFKGIPDRVKEGLSTVGEKIMAPFKKAFNGIAEAWNNGPGKLSFTTPDWLPFGQGGKTWAFPKIPLLDAGAILTGPTLFVGGERRREAVMPLDEFPRLVAPLMDRYYGPDRGGGGSSTSITVNTHSYASGPQIARDISWELSR